MGAVLLVAAKDLRLRARDRSLFLFAVVAPLVLAVVLGAVFGDVEGSIDVDVAVSLDAQDAVGAALVDEVLPSLAEADGPVDRIDAYDTTDEVVTAVETGDADVGLVSAPEGGVEVVASASAPTSASIMAGVVRGTAAETAGVEGLVAALQAVDRPDAIPAAVDAFLASGGSLVSTESVGVGSLDLVTYVAAGIAVFFLFFATGLVVTGILEEERDGTMARLLTAPIPTWAPLAAKGVAAMVVGTASMLVLAVGTTLVLGADWGDPLPLVALVVCAVVAATGVVGLIAATARTPESASAVQAVVGTVLGALGGSFFPITAGGLLGVVALVTPHRWFLDGLRSVSGGDPTGALVPALVLLGMGLVTGTAAMAAARRRIA